jgi:SNF2 family DNA or RNA helicase
MTEPDTMDQDMIGTHPPPPEVESADDKFMSTDGEDDSATHKVQDDMDDAALNRLFEDDQEDDTGPELADEQGGNVDHDLVDEQEVNIDYELTIHQEDDLDHEMENAELEDEPEYREGLQEEVFETVEKELGLEPGSLSQPGVEAAMDDGHDEAQENNDDAMVDVQSEPEEINDDTSREVQGQEDAGHEAGTETVEEAPQNSSSLRSIQVDENYDDEDDQQEDDLSSLFVPEQPSRASAKMPPPSRPLGPIPSRPMASTQVRPLASTPSRSLGPIPSASGTSTFAKIRNMQKKLQEKKNAASKQAAAARTSGHLDNQAYLDAVMAPITPSPSTPIPVVDEDEMADRQATAEFQKQKRHYTELKRKHNGNLPFRQDVEWLKIKGAEEARRKKRARDIAKAKEDEDDEQVLFPEIRPIVEEEQDEELEDAIDPESSSNRKRPRRAMPQKVPKEMSMQEAEFQAMKAAMEANDDKPKKKRKGPPADDGPQDAHATTKGKSKASKSKATTRATRSKAASKPSARGGGRSVKARREIDHAIKQATSLFTSNVFVQQAGAGEADQPTFRARNKTDALKELIASVPIEEQKQARSDMSVLLAATKDFDGRGSVRPEPEKGGWLVKGMKTTLKGYQVMGSAFMRRRENAAEEPRGGLMADQMGLGKTLMMLANIVNGQPPKGRHPRTTLLVASPALLSQWANEIEQHTNCGLRILRYGSGTRLDSNNPMEILKNNDIVLTTYSEVMKSFPKNEPPIECQTVEQKFAWWKTTYENERGLLHRMMFLRIVLDEAQAIKNHLGRTSIACRALMAHHKWTLSGTPILNSLTELYAYFKFLGVPHTGSFKIFKHNYCDTGDVENTERLLVRLSQFMIRRTHADRMFNAPILKLPQADQSTFKCDFNPVERCIYDIVRQRFAKNINMWQKKGDLEKSYSNALVMLLRLRQLTAHVLMLQFVMRDLLEVEDIEQIKEVVQETTVDTESRGGRTITAIRKQLEQHAIQAKKDAAVKAAAAKAAAEDREVDVQDMPDDEDAQSAEQQEDSDSALTQSTGQIGAGGGGSGKKFGKKYDFSPYLDSLKTGESWEKTKKRAKCGYCDKAPVQPWLLSCKHLICSSCLEDSNMQAAEVGKDRSACKVCGVVPISLIEFEIEEDDPFEAVAQGTRSKAAKKAKNQQNRQDRENISDDWLALAGPDVLPSAKTLAIKAQILNWRKEDPNVKVIVYTQFLAM